MVKRPKSPEPVEDSKFLAVVHPFPLNANMDVPNDFKEFMYWLASIVGKDYALGVYYKPSARGMVVGEVSKTFEGFDTLLGEHRWAEFLYKALTEEKERRTRVYYSTYSNGRALQKDGWKCLLADDNLFSDFRPINRKIRHPYPPTRWCDVPYEDPTNKAVCRPLPAATKAPPPRAPVPIPGSSTWSSQKSGVKRPPGAPPSEQKGMPPTKGNAQAGSSKGKAKSPINPDAWKTPITPAPMMKSPSTPAPSSNVPSKSAWAKPLSSASSISAPTPRSISPACATAGTEFESIATQSRSETPSMFSAPPPGLIPPGLVPIPPMGKPTNPLGSSSVATLQHRFASTSIAGSVNSIAATASERSYTIDDSDDYSDGEDAFEFPTAPLVSGYSEPNASSSSAYTALSGSAPRVGKGPGKGRWAQGNVTSAPTTRNQKEDRNDNLWNKVPQSTGRTFRKVIEEDEVCPVHGVVCSKGICSVMKKKKWEKERAEKRKKKKGAERDEGEEASSEVVETQDNDESQASQAGQGERDEVATVSAPSVAASVAASVKSGGGASTVIGSGIKGDWGPKKRRNARQKKYIPDDISESAAVSSARPTHASSNITATEGNSVHGTYTSSVAYSSPRTIPTSDSTRTVRQTPTPKPKPTFQASASASVSHPPSVLDSSSTQSYGATVGTTSNYKNKVKGKGSVGVSSDGSIPGGKGKQEMGAEELKGRSKANLSVPEIKVRTKPKPKTWDEMVEEGDGSELGSVMDFDG